MAKKSTKEGYINADWKNRDDARFENLTPDIRDHLNAHIFKGFIGEKGGKGINVSDRLHLEFTKLPSVKEAEAWEHRTRFRSVLVKAIVELDVQEIRVIYVDDYEMKDDTLIIKGGKEQGWKYTLYCFPSENRIACELYEGSPFQRVQMGVVKFASKEQIEKRRGKHELVNENKSKMEATFRIEPAKFGTAATILFRDDVVVYSKATKGTLEIDAHATENQMKTYSNP